MNTYSEKTEIFGIENLPPILALNSGGEPLRWITYEKSAYYYSKDAVLWGMGTFEAVLRGGKSSLTGKQSVLRMDTIIALSNNRSPTKLRNFTTPPISNKTLFKRDKNVCAYCGHEYPMGKLTRDHVNPVSRGGRDVWENIVTACSGCNQWKADRTPEDSGLKLLYVPYKPTYNEWLILQKRNILADQMDFLMKGVGRNSRLHS